MPVAPKANTSLPTVEHETIFSQDGRRPFELVYHGQFDDSRPGNSVRITGRLSLCTLSLPSKW